MANAPQVGKIADAHESVAAGASLAVQPPTDGGGWLITNLYYGADAEVYKTDGTNAILVLSDTGPGALLNAAFYVTHAYYLTLKNVSEGAAYFGYDGTVTQ